MRRLFLGIATVVLAVVAGAAISEPAYAGGPCGGSPYACADGRFIVYNGAFVCGEWTGNAPNLGSCSNNNTLFANLGYRCSGCDWVRLYWGYNYTGAYFCVPPGYIYGQATIPGLVFDRGSNERGYGQIVWNNAASMKWAGPC